MNGCTHERIDLREGEKLSVNQTYVVIKKNEYRETRFLGELTRDPNRPAAEPYNTSSFNNTGQDCLHAALSHTRVAAAVRPMIAPPESEASVPTKEIPPLVPGGTRANVVMRIGGDFDKIPSSEASVSPRQHAKCLNMPKLC